MLRVRRGAARSLAPVRDVQARVGGRVVRAHGAAPGAVVSCRRFILERLQGDNMCSRWATRGHRMLVDDILARDTPAATGVM